MAIPMAGVNPFFNNAVAATALDVNARPTLVFVIQAINNNTTDSYIQCFNSTAANVVLGSTTPTYSFLMPGGTGASNRGAFTLSFAVPLEFPTAFSIACTTGATTNGAPGNACTVNIGYLPA